MLKTRILKFAVATCTAVTAIGLTGALPAHASTPDAWLVLHASTGCYLYAPGHNVQLMVECNGSAPRDTWQDIRGDEFRDPMTNSKRIAYEIEITSGPSAGLCLNDDSSDYNAVSADSCSPIGADSAEYFWVDNTGIADTHWYRNVLATDNENGNGYEYLTDLGGCGDGNARTGDNVFDSPAGCGGYGAWTAITS
jgi:hypothetical protein